jgi:hypothetical protein
MSRAVPWIALLCLTLAGPSPAAERQTNDAIDRHALRAPEEVETSVRRLAAYLIEPAGDDRQKARAVYRWITDRIAYDVDAYFAGRYGDTSPAAVLRSRKSVCEGYANLFRALCREAGVPVVKVPGKAKSLGFLTGAGGAHTWNAVKLDGSWRLVDATWGAGGIQGKEFVKRFTDYHFLTPPDQFVFTHFPTEAKWQLLDEPVSAEAFRQRPRVDHLLFEMGITAQAVRKVVEHPDFHELVKVYAYPGKPITLHAAPLDGHLKAGAKYRFRIEAESFSRIAVENEGRLHHLARKGKVFEGTVTAPRGKLTLRGLTRNDRQMRFWAILEYEGE